MLLAWQLHIEQLTNQIGHVLQKLSDIPGLHLHAGKINWKIKGAIDRTRDLQQDQNKWICRAFAALFDDHQDQINSLLMRCHDTDFILLTIQELAKLGKVEAVTTLTNEKLSKEADKLKAMITLWEFTDLDKDQLPALINDRLTNLSDAIQRRKLHQKVTDIWIDRKEWKAAMAILKVLIADAIEDKASETTDLSAMSRAFMLALKLFKKMVETEDTDALEAWEMLFSLYQERPSIQADVDDWPTDKRYEERLDYYQSQKTMITHCTILIELLHRNGLEAQWRQLEPLLPAFFNSEIKQYLAIKGEVGSKWTYEHPEAAFQKLFLKATELSTDLGVTCACLTLIVLLDDGDPKESFHQFVNSLFRKDEETPDRRTWLFLTEEWAIHMAIYGFLNEALNIAGRIHYRQWKDEFELVDPGRFNWICEANGHYFALLRRIAFLFSFESDTQSLDTISQLFDKGYRGAWIFNVATQQCDEPPKTIQLIESSMIIERKFATTPAPTEMLPQMDSRAFGGLNEIIKKNAKEKSAFYQWLLKKTFGKNYWEKLLTFQAKTYLDGLRSKSKRLKTIFSQTSINLFLFAVSLWLFLTLIVNIALNVGNLGAWLGLLLFTGLYYLIYRWLSPLAIRLLLDDWLKSDVLKGKFTLFYDWLRPAKQLNTALLMNLKRIKTPGHNEVSRPDTLRQQFPFQIDYHHPKKTFLSALTNLTSQALARKEVFSSAYMLDALIEHKEAVYTDYHDLATGYSLPPYSPNIDLGGHSSYDQLTMQQVRNLCEEGDYQWAFKWVRKIDDPHAITTARMEVAMYRARKNDYRGIYWALDMPVEKYIPSGKAYSDFSYFDGSEASVRMGVYRVLEELTYQGAYELARSLAAQENDEQFKVELLE
ncbi:MAG: hypothetical protein AAFO69_12295, partial [Bacteroidota bacterium]